MTLKLSLILLPLANGYWTNFQSSTLNTTNALGTADAQSEWNCSNQGIGNGNASTDADILYEKILCVLHLNPNSRDFFL